MIARLGQDGASDALATGVGPRRAAGAPGRGFTCLFRRLIWLFGCVAAALALAPAAGATADAPQPAQSAGASVPASRFAKNVAVITIEGPIDAVTARSVSRRIAQATEGGADALVFEINSPGGEVGAVLEICNAIKRSAIKNTVAWVNAQAYSGGALVALACRQIVVASAAALGDAAPIAVDPAKGIKNLAPTERAKILAPLLAEVVDSARRNGYDEKLVQGMVMLGVELWLIENVADPTRRLFIGREEFVELFGKQPPAGSPRLVSGAAPAATRPATPAGAAPANGSPGVGAGAAPGGAGFVPAAPNQPGALVRDVSLGLDTPSTRPVLTGADRDRWRLVEYVTDGNTIVTLRDSELTRYGLAAATVNGDDELKSFFGATNLSRLDRSWSESLVAFLNSYSVKGVLIVVFLLALFLEMTHPGLVLPGTVAALALLTLLAPPMLIGMADWWEVAAILGGIVLIALEIFVLPGFGVPGVLGLVLLFGGLLGTFVPAGSGGLFPDTAEGQSGLIYGVATLAVSVTTSLVLMYFIGKNFGRLPVFGALVLKSPEPSPPGMLEAMGAGDASGPVRAGDRGVTLSPLRPSGRAQFGEDIVDVVSDMGYVAPGEAVRVRAVEGLRIVVERTGPVTGEKGTA